MKANLAVIFFLLIIGCVSKNENQNLKDYFSLGELSVNPNIDSAMNSMVTAELKKLNEADIRKAKGCYYRLTILSPINGTYVITIYQTDTVRSVKFNWEGDKKDKAKSGVKNVLFSYDASGSNFNVLWDQLNSEVRNDSLLFDVPRNLPVVGGDGIIFLLEFKSDIEYKLTLRYEYILRGHFKDSDAFYKIVSAIKAFVPAGVIPNEEDDIKTDRDLLFSIYR